MRIHSIQVVTPRSHLLCRLLVTLLFGTAFAYSIATAQEPWAEVLAEVGPLPSYREKCFESFDTTRALPRKTDLLQWFDILVGQPQGIFETNTRLGRCAGIDGLARCKAPWTEDSALRLMLDDYNRLQIHFFRGETGVTLVYHEDDRFRWAAYATTRTATALTPTSWTLGTTDDGRNRRTSPRQHDQYELRVHAGDVILSRGDVVLIRFPLGGLPSDVLFQGRMVCHGIELSRTRDVPVRPNTVELVAQSAAQLSWTKQLPEGVTYEPDPSGGMRLQVAGSTKQRSSAMTPFSDHQVTELVLEIDEATVGVGVCLGNGQDRVFHVLRYVMDDRTQSLCIMARGDDDQFRHSFRGPNDGVWPIVPEHHWLKILRVGSHVRWSVSADGRTWAEFSEPLRNVSTDLTHWGVHAVRGKEPSTLVIKTVSVRPFSLLNTVVSQESLAATLSAPNAKNMDEWLKTVTSSRPSNFDAQEWTDACALRTISRGCNREVGNPLCLHLARSPRVREWSAEKRLDLLDELALVFNGWDDAGQMATFLQTYWELAEQDFSDRNGIGIREIRRRLMVAPWMCIHDTATVHPGIVRMHILDLVYANLWPELASYTQELRFFQVQQQTPLLEWAEALAYRGRETSPSLNVGRMRDEWREQFIPRVDKEVYNLVTQLREELNSGDRSRVARLIVDFASLDSHGLTEHWRDRELLWSYSSAVTHLLNADAELRTQVGTQHDELARLRLARHEVDNDGVGMRTISTLFRGTPAAAKADSWLGDMALQSGQFALAERNFRRALETAPAEDRLELTTKLAVSRAYQGSDSPPVDAPSLNGKGVSVSAFQSWLNTTRQESIRDRSHRWLGFEPLSDATFTSTNSILRAEQRLSGEGLVGNDVNREGARDMNRLQVDWVNKQLGINRSGRQLFVSNRFQVTAYDLDTKTRLWQSPLPPGSMMFAQDWPLIATRPLILSDRVICRQLYNSGGAIVCLNRVTGQLEWNVAADRVDEWCCDPWLANGRLMCCLMTRTEQQGLILQLIELDPRTGATWQRRELGNLRESWRRRHVGEVAEMEDGVVLMLGGVLLRLDLDGRMAWLRNAPTIPADLEATWIQQYVQPPLLDAERLFVLHPGSRRVECVARDTGEMLWARVVPDVTRCVAEHGDVLVVQELESFIGLSKSDGTTLWKTPVPRPQVGIAANRSSHLVVTSLRDDPSDAKKFVPALVTLDMVTGLILAESSFNELSDASPRMGPLLPDHDRWWTFLGRGQNDAHVDFIEIHP